MLQSYPPKYLPIGAGLTPLGAEIVSLLAQGLSMKEVARELKIPVRTVAFHKCRTMEANDLRSSAELLNFAIRVGLLPPASSVEQILRERCR